jgi:2-dehydropantoate 2-reductase
MRFVSLGFGAIGGSIGGRLVHTGHEVVAIARGAHLAAIRTHGVILEAPEGSVTVRLPAVERPAEIAWRPDDVVLLAVKTQDAAAALQQLAAVAPPTVAVVCLTNGLETERLALRWFRDVHGVNIMLPASYLVPGVVQLWATPVRGVLDIGRAPAGMSAIDEQVAAAFREAGFVSQACGDIVRWKRNKLLSNLGNALEALCGPNARGGPLLERVMEEGRACFTAAGLSWASPEEEAARRQGLRMGEIAGATRAGGSTWQSLARGVRDVESDYLNGEIVLMGRLYGVPTPLNERLQRLVAEAAREGRPPGSMSPSELLVMLEASQPI